MTTFTELTRRKVLRGGVTLAVASRAPSADETWTVGELHLRPGQPVALSETLPPRVARGGRFSLAAGSLLPPGVSLSASGVLVATTADVELADVQFEYEPLS